MYRLVEEDPKINAQSDNMDTLCPDDVEAWCFNHFDRDNGVVTIFFRILAPLSLKVQLENNVSS